MNKIDKLKTRGTAHDETLFILRDPDQTYTHSEVCDLLEGAELMGFSLERGTELERLTVRELDVLIHRRQ